MSKNYQMSDLMKAAIVNSLLTVILINVSFVLQSNHSRAEFDKRMKRNAMEERKMREIPKITGNKDGRIPLPTQQQQTPPQPEQPQMFYPNH